ncbi:BSD domain-containing protein 1-like [Fagus crenata]
MGDYIPYVASLDLQGLTKRMKAVSKIFDDFFEKIIDEHVQSKEENKTKDFVDVMLGIMGSEESESRIERPNIKAIILKTESREREIHRRAWWWFGCDGSTVGLSLDFFKSVFSDEPDRLQPQNDDDSEPNSDPNSNDTWSFSGLIKTIASRSESTIQNYKQELEEFGSGLKKETSVIREVASRAVKDLPGSLDVGASVAQESLESVGQAIDDIGASVWNSTAEIISHGTDKLLGPDPDSDSNSSDNNNTRIGTRTSQLSNLKRQLNFALLR